MQRSLVAVFGRIINCWRKRRTENYGTGALSLAFFLLRNLLLLLLLGLASSISLIRPHWIMTNSDSFGRRLVSWLFAVDRTNFDRWWSTLMRLMRLISSHDLDLYLADLLSISNIAHSSLRLFECLSRVVKANVEINCFSLTQLSPIKKEGKKQR